MNSTTGWVKTVTVLGLAAVLSGVVTVTSSVPTPITPTHEPPIALETAVRIKLFVTTFNAVVILSLLWNYGMIYRDIPNRFTLSLAVVTLALLFYAVMSNPLLPMLLGFMQGTTLGPFTFLPDIFASIAATILLYQSYA